MKFKFKTLVLALTLMFGITTNVMAEGEKSEAVQTKQTINMEDVYEKTLENYEKESFDLNEKITRAEAAMILNELVDDERPTTKMFVRFKDLDMDNPAYNAINILVNQRIIAGYPDDTFKPEGNLTRAEAAQIFQNIHGIAPLIAVTPESDYYGHWAEVPMQTGVTMGYIEADKDGKYNPDETITRGEFEKMAKTYFENI